MKRANLAPALTYAAWAANIAWPDVADSSPNGDPDGDGLTNALEFVLGTDPLSPTAAGRPELIANGAEFQYRRRRSAVGVTVDVEVSTDLQTWNSAGSGLRLDEADTVTDLYSILLPAGVPRAFARLRVTVN